MDMSGFADMPVIGNTIFVPACYSHKEVDPEDDYFTLHEIHDPGDGVCYCLTRPVGGKNGTISSDEDDIIQINLDEFRLFRGFYMCKH